MKKLILFILFTTSFLTGISQIGAIDSLENALALTTTDTARINALNSIAEGLRFSDPEKMYAYSHQARALSSSVAYGKGLVKAIYNLATYFETYRHEDSVQYYFKQSLQLSDSLNDPLTYTLTRNAQGLYLVSKRRFEEALSIFYDVLRRHEESQNMYGQMAAYNNIGLVAMETRQYQSAIASFKKALPFQPDPHPVILNNIGSCYGSLSKYDSARHYVTLAIKRAREVNDAQAEANGLHILGTVYMSAKKYEEALENFLVAEKIRQKAPSKAMLVADYTNISSLYAHLKQPDKGIHYGMKALKMAQKEELDYKIENIYEALAMNHMAAGNYPLASEYYKKWGIDKDSSYTKAQAEALAEIKARYETEKKEQEIQIRDLKLAEQELLLNQKNLQLYSSIGGVGVLLILLYLAFNRLQLQKRVQQLEFVHKMQSERERISADLHDHVGAQLTSIMSGLQITEEIEGFRKDEEVKNIIDSLKEDARETLASLRASIWSLHLSEITGPDFIEHIERHLANVLKYQPGVVYEIRSDVGSDLVLAPREALNLTRTVQEAVQNILKHANATAITMTISKKERLTLWIADNGKGFDTQMAQLGDHYGLLNMKRRVEEIGGTMNIISRPGEGTTLFIRI